MRVVLFIIMAFWLLPASSQTLKIMGSDEGFLPFYYGNDLNEGILVEVINEFTLQTGVAADFLPMARKRQPWALERGLANAVFANPLWMPLPDRMHTVGPLLTWRDRVFAQPGRQPDSFDELKEAFVFADGLSTVIGSSGGSGAIWCAMTRTTPGRCCKCFCTNAAITLS